MRKLNSNEKMMIALAVMFTIGIIMRWEYVRSELVGVFDHYFGTAVVSDTLKNGSVQTDSMLVAPDSTKLSK